MHKKKSFGYDFSVENLIYGFNFYGVIFLIYNNLFSVLNIRSFSDSSWN